MTKFLLFIFSMILSCSTFALHLDDQGYLVGEARGSEIRQVLEQPRMQPCLRSYFLATAHQIEVAMANAIERIEITRENKIYEMKFHYADTNEPKVQTCYGGSTK